MSKPAAQRVREARAIREAIARDEKPPKFSDAPIATPAERIRAAKAKRAETATATAAGAGAKAKPRRTRPAADA